MTSSLNFFSSKESEDEHLLVSVLVTTYNHEEFVYCSLDSALMQRGDFRLEIIVCDDCSTDRTVVLLDAYRDIPNVHVFVNETNLGLGPNLLRGFKRCSGKYIAMLEGDDFWTDRNKLSQQVTYMESHPNCMVCCHAIRLVDQAGKVLQEPSLINDHPQEFNLSDLLSGNFIRNCSVLYRRVQLHQFNGPFLGLPSCDFQLHVFHVLMGPPDSTIAWLPKRMASYRIHQNSSYSSKSKLHDLIYRDQLYLLFYAVLPPNLRRTCLYQHLLAVYGQFLFYLRSRDLPEAVHSFCRLIGFRCYAIRILFMVKAVVRSVLELPLLAGK